MAERSLKLEIRDMTKRYDNGDGVEHINLKIYEGEIVTMLGPSGCGKSTLLNIIAGMLAPDGGRVTMNGQVISEAGKVLPPEKRHMNMVFQDFALWPHMTAYDNIAYGLKRSKTGKEEIEERVQELLKLLHLEGLEKRYPAELSGGEQQRVAIARALVNNPRMIIADAPTGNLDPVRSLELMLLLEKINELGTTVLVVTHEKELVDAFSKRVISIDAGRVISDGLDGYYGYEAE